MNLFFNFKLQSMRVFRFCVHYKLLNQVSGLRDAELGVAMQIILIWTPLNSWKRWKPKQYFKMEENTDSNMDEEQPPPERKEGNKKCFHLFNCDKTYNLDVVEKFLNAIKDKLSFDISIPTKKYFALFEMTELCKTIQSGPPMDFAAFVVHANESRLSINEENAGIGYARFYRALLEATGEWFKGEVFYLQIRLWEPRSLHISSYAKKKRKALIRKVSYQGFCEKNQHWNSSLLRKIVQC